jgi:hypothetical protein
MFKVKAEEASAAMSTAILGEVSDRKAAGIQSTASRVKEGNIRSSSSSLTHHHTSRRCGSTRGGMPCRRDRLLMHFCSATRFFGGFLREILFDIPAAVPSEQPGQLVVVELSVLYFLGQLVVAADGGENGADGACGEESSRVNPSVSQSVSAMPQ